MDQVAVAIEDLAVHYPEHPALDRVSLSLRRGAIACLGGVSGSGKTTLLYAIAGFVAVTRGAIRIGGKLVSRPGLSVAPEDRGTGMVFQDFALFPHLDAAGNIEAALRKWRGAGRAAQVRRCLERFGLGGFAHSYPQAMSGGQQQRLALARALASEPEVLLLDEPFANIDRELRIETGSLLRRIVGEQGIACLLVTHDLSDALALGDRVGILEQGRIVQWDEPAALYRRPRHPATVRLLGHGALLRGVAHTPGFARTVLGDLVLDEEGDTRGEQGLEVWVRPEQLEIDNASPGNAGVLRVLDNGVGRQARLQLDSGEQLLASYGNGVELLPGERCTVRPAPGKYLAFALSL